MCFLSCFIPNLPLPPLVVKKKKKKSKWDGLGCFTRLILQYDIQLFFTTCRCADVVLGQNQNQGK